MITIFFENNSNHKIDPEIFDPVLQAMNNEKLSSYEEVNLLLADDETVQNLNRKFRGKNSKTDVLSFPSQIPGLPFLGDIIIDTSVADKQKGNCNLEKELQLLFLHAVLHLLGYDHISATQKTVMNDIENQYRKNLNIILGV